eukprot:evm.model.scf_1841EXC.3 EVM.evm.TU.scf_1841EXC.3   scf_1841EXC:18023-23684(-)
MTGCPRYIRGPSLWGSLHESLLERIFAKLPMLDLPQAREVCRQWVLPAGWCMKALKPLAWSHDLIHKFPNIERLDLSTATLCPGDLEMIAESFSRLGTLVLNKSKLVPIREEEKLGEGLTVMGTPAARESDGWGLHDLGAITSVDMSGCPRFDTRIFSVPQILATVRCLSLYGLDWIEDREFQNILRCCQYTLSSLDISWCKGLRRASIECLTGCPRLRDLSAEGCMRFGIEGFAQMSDLTSLRALNVAASPADDFTQEPLSGYNAHGLLLLSRMDHLTSLDVSNWPINNDELATVGTLTELRRLALNHCHLVSNTGLRHLTHVTALESLEVHGCNIMTPSLSTARFDFKRLRSISVLSGGVPHNMTNSPALLVEVVEKVGRELTSIEHIDLSYTCHCMDPCFPGVLDALYAVTTITSLDFTGSQGLMDHGLLALPRMMGLKKLRLARVSELTDATLFIVSRVTNLTFLDLSMGLYTDAGIVALKALVVLEELDLRSCPNITNQGVRELNVLDSLGYLSLKNCTGVQMNALPARLKIASSRQSGRLEKKHADWTQRLASAR